MPYLPLEILMSNHDVPDTAVESTAAIARHPLHPMIVPFPIAFLVGAALADIAFMTSDDAFWARAALWLVGAGVVGGALAAVLGLIDYLTIERARTVSAGRIHLIGNALAVVLSLVSWIMRDGETVTTAQMIISIVVVLILVFTGWFGGELAYRYKIGVMRSQRDISGGARAPRPSRPSPRR
jgi:uncharacterized membrane protein